MSVDRDVSVVVLAGGRWAALARCLAALASGAHVPGEVLLVETSAKRRVPAALRDRFKHHLNIRVVEALAGGFAEKRNRGVAESTTAFVAFVDDDCYVDRYWLERLAATLRAGAEAAGGPLMAARDLPAPPDCAPESVWAAGLTTAMFFTPLAGKIELPTTSNLMLRRSLWQRIPFQEVGGDLNRVDARENYLVGREDASWWRSCREAGADVRPVPNAIVWHDIPVRRLRRRELVRRAQSDGRAHWQRERPVAEISRACEEVVHSPVRMITDVLQTDRDWPVVKTHHAVWAARQRALVDAAVDDPSGIVPPTRRTSAYARSGVRLALNLAKAPVRRLASTLHHEFKGLRPLPRDPRTIRTLALVCYNNLGDAVLTIPMIQLLRRACPNARLVYLCGDVAAPMMAPLVDEVIRLPRTTISTSVARAELAAARRLRALDPDAIVMSYHHSRLPLSLFASTRAPVICWNSDQGMRNLLWRELASAVVPKDLTKHEIVSLLNLLGPLGIPVDRLERPRLPAYHEAAARVEQWLAQQQLTAGEYAVVVMDGEPGSPKAWAPERLASVGRHLHERHGLRVVFDGRRQSRWLFERSLSSADASWAVSSHGVFDTAELAEFLRRARVLVSTDSGPAHVAQAVETPTLTLFGHMDEQRWGALPRQPHESLVVPHRTVRADDAPFSWLPEERLHLPEDIHMQRLTVDKVCGEVDALLREMATQVS